MSGNLVPYNRNRQSGMSERERDPIFRGRSPANRRTVYGGVPVKRPQTGPRTTVNPKSKPVSLLELARRDVIPAYKPQRDVVDRLIGREEQDAAKRAAFMQQVYANFAQFMQGIAPQIQANYQNAGRDIAGFARGQQQGLQLQEDASAQGMGDVLARIGAPQGQNPQDYQAAERLYDLTGYLPAATIAGQGAAFGAYAAGLPGIYAQKGIADILAAKGESQKRIRDLQDDLLKIKAQESADVLKQLGILRTNRATDRSKSQALAEQRRQFNAELNFRKAVARSQDLLDRGKVQLSIAELDAEIADQKADRAIAQQNADTSAVNAATSRIRMLNDAKAAARKARLAAQTENRLRGKVTPAPEAVSRSSGFMMGYDSNGKLIYLKRRNVNGVLVRIKYRPPASRGGGSTDDAPVR